MKIWVGQIYIEAGVNFPFSHLWQRWMSQQLSLLARPTAKFVKKYGDDFEFMINLSARSQLSDNELRGPSVFRKSKDVEYSLFLPYDIIIRAPDGCRVAMEFILKGIQDIFAKVGIEAEGFDARKASMIEHACSNPTMLEKPWTK